MSSSAEEIANYLADNYVGSFAVDIFVGNEPAKPNNVVTVYDSGGDGLDTDEMDLGRDEIQVRVRDMSYTNGRQKQKEIRNILVAVQGTLIESRSYVMIHPATSILYIGKDDNNRHLFTSNYRVVRNET